MVGRQARKVKLQIQQELGAKPEISKEGEYTPGLTEWLVSTLLLVSAEEYSDSRVRRSPCTRRARSKLDEKNMRKYKVGACGLRDGRGLGG